MLLQALSDTELETICKDASLKALMLPFDEQKKPILNSYVYLNISNSLKSFIFLMQLLALRNL